MRKFALWLLHLDLSLWFGAGIYFSLMAAEELGRLPLNQFAAAVGLLFPPLFTLMAVTAIVGWVLYAWLGSQSRIVSRSFRAGHIVFLIGVLAALANRLVLLPLLQHVERQMGSFLNATAAQQAQFGMMHGMSLLVHFVGMLMALLAWLCLTLNLRME
ncbi:DUF4149 domain-containing protein [Alicyclobacillus cycloheptanicus]|uniref:TMEM205-like domain-containing protein n=1 Tax=Alicyclobacillus cycloheptanicus TaxID=1457 RepID=A0ABT9XG07_9BACL|nr:DUF4149 domain-containing protein [Alicyclobacillus cycloheptanicus]MDQ0189004.1 hypothetical protein [Alicyclobacillus cycloheptanicus]WDM01655.1 DUF4149 domain-containing protein [Alicyclobacillus cycloheptanicus]